MAEPAATIIPRMIVPNHIMTAEQLEQAGDLGRCELLRGELVMMSPAGSRHGDVANNLAFHLTLHAKATGQGKVKAAETGFILERNPDTVRAPDVAFVRASRLHLDTREGFFPGPPDLAVEVLSPGDGAGEVLEKVQQWLDAGCERVWIADPPRGTITVHRKDNPVRVWREGETLVDESLLPGFSLPVSDVFAD